LSSRRDEHGFSLAEMLVVIAIIGLFCLVAIPAVNNFIRAGKVRTANDTLMGDLRAVRYIAITNHATATLTINGAAGTWSYLDVHGNTVSRVMEKGVNFVPASGTTNISFASDGTTTSGGTTIVIQGNVLPSVDHQFTIGITTVGRLTSTFARV
jgi:prepilin-type N-terminal cleavage/methylation domain-containing protein